MKKILKNYVNYDLESTYEKQLKTADENEISKLLEQGKLKHAYAVKKIISGKLTELMIYPEFTKKQKNQYKVKMPKKQKNLNDRYSRKRCERLINANFKTNDIFLTLTYDNERLPTYEKSKKNMVNYLRRVKRLFHKKGLDNPKYIYVTEFVDEDGNTVRMHHHLIISQGLTRDELEDAWHGGMITNSKRVQENSNGITALANYLTKGKRKKSMKLWTSSKNLKKPIVHKHHRIAQKQIKKLITDKNEIQRYADKHYPAYNKISEESYYNQVNGFTYFYIKMIKTSNRLLE